MTRVPVPVEELGLDDEDAPDLGMIFLDLDEDVGGSGEATADTATDCVSARGECVT